MEGLDSSREERDGGVPRGPGGPPHQINAGPRVRENYVALTVRERLVRDVERRNPETV